MFVAACVLSSCGKQGPLFVVVHRLFITVASLVVEHGLWLWHTGPVALRHVESSWTRDQTHVPCIGRRTPIHYATREVLPVV